MVNKTRRSKRQPLMFCMYWRLSTDTGSGGQNGLRPSRELNPVFHDCVSELLTNLLKKTRFISIL